MKLSIVIVGTQAGIFAYPFFCSVSYFNARKPGLYLKETEWEE